MHHSVGRTTSYKIHLLSFSHIYPFVNIPGLTSCGLDIQLLVNLTNMFLRTKMNATCGNINRVTEDE